MTTVFWLLIHDYNFFTPLGQDIFLHLRQTVYKFSKLHFSWFRTLFKHWSCFARRIQSRPTDLMSSRILMVILIMSNSFSHHFISMTITNSMNFFLKNPQKTYLLISVYMASYKASKRILFSTVNTFLCMIVYHRYRLFKSQ